MRFRVPEFFIGFLLGVAVIAVSEIFISKSSIFVSALALLQSVSVALFALFYDFTLFKTKDSPEHMIEGLLHLGAMAMIFTAAYLGIDDPKKVRSHIVGAPDYAAKKFEEITKEVNQFTHELGASITDFEREHTFDTMPTRILAHIAGKQLDMTLWSRILFFIYRNSRLPFYNWFLRRHDLKIGWTLTLISAFFFLFLVATKVWKLALFESPPLLVFCYFIFSFTIVCCFVGLAAQYRLAKIVKVIDQEAYLARAKLAKQYRDALRVISKS